MQAISPIWLLSVLLAGCVHVVAQHDQLAPITILHTNDVHGYGWPVVRKDGALRGGFAAQALAVERVRAEVEAKHGILLLLSAGDVNTGAPESDLLKAEPDFMAMNRIGYDAMALGNHDLDGGKEKLTRQVGWAKFPILSANVRPLLAPHVVLNKNGLRIGIIGLTTSSLKRIALPQNVAGLDVEEPIPVARREAERLKAEGAEVIIALTHIGISPMGLPDDLAVAREVPVLAAVVGGHSHTLLRQGVRVGHTMVVQAGEKGEYLGRLDLVWNRDKHELVESRASVIPLNVSEGEDRQIAEMMTEYRARSSQELNEEIGRAEVALEIEKHSAQESNLGDFICDVLRAMTKSDVAVYNTGGLRAPIPKGIIHVRDLLQVLPFRNTVVTGMIRGKTLKTALQAGLDNRGRSGSFLQVSGLSYEIYGRQVKNVAVDGHPLADGTLLKIAANNFLFSGGDYFEEFRNISETEDTGLPVDEVVARFLRSHPKVRTEIEGRIRVAH